MDKMKGIPKLVGLIVIFIGGLWFIGGCVDLSQLIILFNLFGGMSTEILIGSILEFLLTPFVIIIIGLIIFLYGEVIIKRLFDIDK